MKKILFVSLLTLLSYPAVAEKATPENEIAVALIRTLHPTGNERMELYCPPKPIKGEECRVTKFVRDTEAASGVTTRAKAITLVRKFFKSLPKADVKKGKGSKQLKPSQETAYVWFVSDEKNFATGEIRQTDLQDDSKARSLRVGALGALEFRLISLLKP